MPKQPARNGAQRAKYLEQQLRKRQAQTRSYSAPTDEIALAEAEMPVATVQTFTASRRPNAARNPLGVPTPPMVRTRGRLTVQREELSIEEEMQHIKGDLRRMLVLAAVCLLMLAVCTFIFV